MGLFIRQRGVNLVQTIVQPRTLTQLAQAPASGADDIEFEVPILQLPALDTDVTSQSSVEAGAKGMLQVRLIPIMATYMYMYITVKSCITMEVVL